MYNLLKKLYTQRSTIKVDLGDQTLEAVLFSFEDERRWFTQGLQLRKVVTPNTAWFKHDAADKSPEINCRVHYDKTTKKIVLKTTQEASFYLHYRLLAVIMVIGVATYMLQDKLDIKVYVVFCGFAIVYFIFYAVALFSEIKSFNSELKREIIIRINHSRGTF